MRHTVWIRTAAVAVLAGSSWASAQLTCESGAAHSQEPASPYTGVVSDWGPPNHPVDSFTSPGSIGEVTVWGYWLDSEGAAVDAPVGGGEAWGFDVYYYGDDGGAPADGGGFLGRLIKQEFFSDANGDPTGFSVEDTGATSPEGSKIYKITSSGITTVEVPAGPAWVGFFRWGPNIFHIATGSDGDNSHLNGADPLTNTAATGDLAFCISAAGGTGEGEGEGEGGVTPVIVQSPSGFVEVGESVTLTAPAGGTGYSWSREGGFDVSSLVICDYDGSTECGSPSFDNDASDGGYPTDTPDGASANSRLVVIDPTTSASTRGDYFIGGLGTLDMSAYGYFNFYTKWTGDISEFRIEIFSDGFNGGVGQSLLSSGDLPAEGEWGYLSFSMADINAWDPGHAFGTFDFSLIDSMSFRLNATDGQPPVNVWFDHFTFSETPADGMLPASAEGRISGITTNALSISPVVLDDGGLYTVSYDDGSKAPVTLSTFLTVANQVPITGLVGLGALAGALALGVAVRRRKS